MLQANNGTPTPFSPILRKTQKKNGDLNLKRERGRGKKIHSKKYFNLHIPFTKITSTNILQNGTFAQSPRNSGDALLKTEMSSPGKQASGYAYWQERRGRLNERVNIYLWHLQVFAPDYPRPWISPMDKKNKNYLQIPSLHRHCFHLKRLKFTKCEKEHQMRQASKNAEEIRILWMDLSRMGVSGRLHFAVGQKPKRKDESGWRGKGGGGGVYTRVQSRTNVVSLEWGFET